MNRSNLFQFQLRQPNRQVVLKEDTQKQLKVLLLHMVNKIN